MSKKKDRNGKYWGHKRGRNYHHIINRKDGGESTRENLLFIKEDRHREWHTLFGDKTIDEVIALLIRLSLAKKYK